MERALLYKEISHLQEPLANGTSYEATIAGKINLFLKQTAYKFPKMFIGLLLSNERRENILTDRFFFERHPERNNRKLKKNEKKLIREWLSIRRNVVRPILKHLSGTGSDITKIDSKDLFTDILRYIISWLDAYIIAVDNFKYITEKSTEAELKELKGISGKFLFEIAREAVDIIVDFAGEVPVIGTALKTIKAVGSIANLMNRYQERQAQYQALKNKNDLVNFVVSERELFSNIKIDLNNQFRDLAELYVPMMRKDKFIRARFEDIYRRSKRVSYTNQNELFKLVCEKWAQQFPKHTLLIFFNSNLKIVATKFHEVPFGEQLLAKLKSSAGGLNLDTFKVNRRVVFYPLSVSVPTAYFDKNISLRYEFLKDTKGNVGRLNQYGSPQLVNPDSFNKAVKLSLSPLPILK